MNRYFLYLVITIFSMTLFSCQSYEDKLQELKIKEFERILAVNSKGHYSIVKQSKSSQPTKNLYTNKDEHPLSVLEFDYNDDGYNDLYAVVFDREMDEYDIAVADIKAEYVFFLSDDLGYETLNLLGDFHCLDWEIGVFPYQNGFWENSFSGMLIRNPNTNKTYAIQFWVGCTRFTLFDEYSERERVVNQILKVTNNTNYSIVHQVRNTTEYPICNSKYDKYPPSVLAYDLNGDGSEEYICFLNDSINQSNNIAIIDKKKSIVRLAYKKTDDSDKMIYAINHFYTKNMIDWGIDIHNDHATGKFNLLKVWLTFPQSDFSTLSIYYWKDKYVFSYKE